MITSSSQTGLWSLYVLPPPFWSFTLCSFHALSQGCTQSNINALLLKLPKSRITAHLHSFVSLPACRINFHMLFNHIFPSRSSKQLFTAISHRPQFKIMIFSTLVIPTQISPNFSFSSLEFPSLCLCVLHSVFVCYILIRSVY